MANEYEEVDDGWVLLSSRMEIKHNRQPSQASMKPLKVGRMLKYAGQYVTKQVKTRACELPEDAACANIPAKDKLERTGPSTVKQIRRNAAGQSDGEASSNACVVPEHFALSPSTSPKTAADFMATESLSLEPLEELPPPALEFEDEALIPPYTTFKVSSGDRAHKAELPRSPSVLRRRRIPSDKAPVAVSRRVASERTDDANSEDDMTIISSPLQGSIQSMFEKEVEESFVQVSTTPATAARWFAFQHPRTATGFLWCWFLLLVMGELGTTIWWTYSIGFHGLLVISAPAALGLAFGLLTFGPEQMIAIAVAVSLAAMPALPAYSAVLLMMPVEGSEEKSSSCWDSILHVPILAVICVTFFLSALVPALRAERPEKGTLTYIALQTLEGAQKVAKSACVLSAYVYVSVVLTSARESAHLSGGAALVGPILTGRGWVLFLHMLGLMCAYSRQRTVAYLGEDLLPRLIGRKRAKKLTVRALVLDHGRKFLKGVPQLRRFSPPMKVVALVVAVRRTAPILFPVLAVLPQLVDPEWKPGALLSHPQSLANSSRGWPTLALILGLMVVAILAIAAAHEQRSLPGSDLRRLPLLLPSGVTPCTRKFLGYALVAAEGVERARRGVSSLKTQMQRIIST